MPFALVFIGLLMVVSGAKNTYKELGAELVQDFTGPGNFTWWVLAIGAVGAIGYYAPARNFSRAFMALIIISMVIAQQRSGGGGFFGQLENALRSGPETVKAPDEKPSAFGNAIAPVDLTIPTTATNQRAQENFQTVLGAVSKIWSPF